MKKIDSRQLSPKEQYNRRSAVVRLHKEGKSNQQIHKKVGISITHVSTILQKYFKGGRDAIKLKVRGRKEGEKRRLSLVQEEEIINLLILKPPVKNKSNFHLWTRESVKEAILKRFEIDLPIRRITDYLKRWGFSANKPIKQVDRKIPTPYKNWLKSEYPEIVARSKKENLRIYWVDEICVKQYNQKGHCLSAICSESINMISAISNQGEVRFTVYKNKITHLKFIRFMSRLIKLSDRKVLLIFYNHKVLKSREVEAWQKKRNDKIELLYLNGCYLSQH